MSDRSSTYTIIVEFNRAEELIDSEIIAVHRIVSNMKKREVGRGPKGRCTRAFGRWWTVVRNNYGMSRVNETRIGGREEDDLARERNDLKLMSLLRLRRVGVSRAAPRMHEGFPTPLRFIPRACRSSKRVVFSFTISCSDEVHSRIRKNHSITNQIVIR